MAKRDRVQIMVSILNTCVRGANKTRIVYQANLNFRTVTPYLSLLEKNDLITVSKDSNIIYKTTPKGEELIDKLACLEEILDLDQ
jgi:predicted transcriptional regulator